MSADLNAIKARWAAATPGPWEVKVDYLDTVTGEGGDPYISAPLMEVVADVSDSDDANAEAIAHAPEDIAALIQALEEAVTRIDEIEKWATDHFGDSTEFPTDLAFAFWGMPSAADLEVDEDECIDDTDLCEHGLRFGCEACAEESP